MLGRNEAEIRAAVCSIEGKACRRFNLPTTRSGETEGRGHSTASDRKRVGVAGEQEGRVNPTAECMDRITQRDGGTLLERETERGQLLMQVEQIQQQLRDKAEVAEQMQDQMEEI